MKGLGPTKKNVSTLVPKNTQFDIVTYIETTVISKQLYIQMQHVASTNTVFFKLSKMAILTVV